jgi:hypothetical protein
MRSRHSCAKVFDMKDLSEADVILNIKLIKGENVITLTQSHYVEKVLSHFGYKDNKPSPTPYNLSFVLRKNKRIGRYQLSYSQMTRSLMYLASETRPDISFAMRDDHWRVFERVMHYLVCTMDYKIHYFGYPAVLEGYSDANWISDMDELYVMSGYIFTFGGASVLWRSCK